MLKRFLIFVLCTPLFFICPNEQLTLITDANAHDKQRHIVIKNYYGIFDITEPVLCDLLECPSVKRLDKINQYGIDTFVNDFPRYTRYQHSVGVMCLLRRFGASLQEQIAGLLHDVSHTVFSHVGDHLFGATRTAITLRDSKDSYQDSIHGWFMEQTEIAEVLAHHGYTVDDVIHKNGMFVMLEQDIPDLCADRLEYNLYGGFIEDCITHDDITFILDALRFEDGRWFFVDAIAARKLANASLFLTEHHFGTSWNALLNTWAAQALRRALDVEIVCAHELHFSTDDVIWRVINESDDGMVKGLLQKLYNYKQYYKDVTVTEPHDYTIYPKFRGINPLVQKSAQAFVRLCECDEGYKQEYERVKGILKQGRAVQFLG